MSIEKAKNYLKQFGADSRVLEFDVSSATVELAAQAVGCEPARIAKTLSFRTNDGVILIVAAGDAKVDNPKYKARFGCKAKMLAFEEVEPEIGLAVGFAVNAIIKPYNNYPLIQRLFREYLQAYPAALQELLCRGHYPDIQPFGERYRRLLGEVAIFADQPLPSRRRRAHEAAYLRGCCQLAEKMYMSIAALAGMDTASQTGAQ